MNTPRPPVDQLQIAVTLFSLVLLGVLIWLLAPILTPFVVSAGLAYLFDPLADWLERRKLSRTVAVCLVFLIMSMLLIICILVVIPLLQRQIDYLIERGPDYATWLNEVGMPWLETQIGMTFALPESEDIVSIVQQHWQSAGGFIGELISSISKSGLAVVGWIANLALIPVVTWYLLRDWDRLIENIHHLLPRSIEPVIVKLTRESDEVLGAFIRGQLLVMLGLGLIYIVGLWLVGLKLALLIGSVAGLLSVVPYLGTIIGIVAGLIAAVVQFGDWVHVGLVALVFAIGQVLEGNILTPLLVGDRIGLHPVAVIFAILAGGALFGFVGVLIALPAAAVIMVVLRYLINEYKDSRLYQTQALDEGPEDTIVHDESE